MKKSKKSKKTRTQRADSERVHPGDVIRPVAHPFQPQTTAQNRGGKSPGRVVADADCDSTSSQKSAVRGDEDTDNSSLSTTVAIFKSLLRDAFYVRPCFPDYYDYIVDAFDAERLGAVTVIGASGVGTSVFLAYFLYRYERHHPNSSFVYVAYDSRCRFMQAQLWKNGAVAKELTRAEKFEEENFDRDAIFLLDGPPKQLPWSAHRYVVCASMNETWIAVTRHLRYHEKIYMPLWDVNELTTAVEALGFNGMLSPMRAIAGFPRSAGESEVAYRFRVFGGIARPCLETTVSIVDAHARKLKDAAKVVNLRTGLLPRLPLDFNDDDNVSHLLYHCFPASDQFFRELKTASLYVTQLLSARVDALSENDREVFYLSVTGCPPAAALNEAIQAARMLALLANGVQLVAKSLAHPCKSPEFDLKLSVRRSDSTKALNSNRFQGSDLARGQLYVPRGNAFETIAAVYLVDAGSGQASEPWGDVEAVVFLPPPLNGVQGWRLYSLLKQLDLARDAPRRVALVFGVAESEVEFFKEVQQIRCSLRVEDTAPVDHVTTEMATKLKAARVVTVHDLRHLLAGVQLNNEHDQVYELAREHLAIQENDAVVPDTASHALLKEIPQFVWVVKE